LAAYGTLALVRQAEYYLLLYGIVIWKPITKPATQIDNIKDLTQNIDQQGILPWQGRWNACEAGLWT